MEHILEQLLVQLRAVWRRRWVILPVAWLISLGGWAWVHQLPDEFEASAQVYVDTQSLLDALLGGMAVRPDAEQRVRMVSNTLITRPNMEEVARNADLEALVPGRNLEGIVDDLVSGVRLRVARQSGTYTVSYRHHRPEVAHRVTEELVNFFMEQGIGATRTDLAGSQRFIQRQLESYEERLREKERELEQFRHQHAGLVYGRDGAFYNRLATAAQRLEEAELELREVERQRDALRGQMAGERIDPDDLAPSDRPRSALVELNERIAAYTRQLDDMLLRYADQHPDVRATRRLIGDLQDERARLLAEAGGGDGGDALTEDLMRQQVGLALAEAEIRVSNLEARVEEFRERHQRLSSAVDEIPEIEARFSELTRDYRILKEGYERFRATRERAAITGDVQAQTDTVDFRVIEPARLPASPAAPHRPALASAVLMLGLVAGSGLAFLIAQLRTTVTTVRTLTEWTGRPCLGSVAYVATPARRRRQWIERAVYTAVAAGLFGAYGVTVYTFMAG